MLPVEVQSAFCTACSTFDREVRTSNDDELGLAGSQSLEGRLVAQHVLARLHNKRKARVDGVGVLL